MARSASGVAGLAVRTGGCELEHRVAVRFGGESLDRGVLFGELAPDPAPARVRRGPGSVTAGNRACGTKVPARRGLWPWRATTVAGTVGA